MEAETNAVVMDSSRAALSESEQHHQQQQCASRSLARDNKVTRQDADPPSSAYDALQSICNNSKLRLSMGANRCYGDDMQRQQLLSLSWLLSWMRCCCCYYNGRQFSRQQSSWTAHWPSSSSSSTRTPATESNSTKTLSRRKHGLFFNVSRISTVVLLLLFCHAVPLHAEEDGDNDGDGDNDAADNNNNNNEGGSSSNRNNSNNVINAEAFLDVHASCNGHDNNSKNKIEAGLQVKVTSVYLICDSPGAYYQGSKTYRNSAVCTEGDSAKLSVGLTIKYSGEEHSNNEYIYMSMDTGYYGDFSNVLSSSVLCQNAIESYTGGKCPAPGQYQINLSYEVLKGVSDDEYETVHYTPDIRLRFTNDKGQFAGCATAGMRGWRRSHEVKARNGIIALACATVAFGVTFALLLYLSYRRRKRLESLAERKKEQYQYFGTLPNGQVVPFPSQQQPPPPPQSQHQSTAAGNLNAHAQQQMQNVEHMRRLQQQHAEYMMHQQQLQQHQAVHQQHHHSAQQQPQLAYDDSYSEEGSPQRPNRAAAPNQPPNNNNIHMISNPAYNETHLPTRPII